MKFIIFLAIFGAAKAASIGQVSSNILAPLPEVPSILGPVVSVSGSVGGNGGTGKGLAAAGTLAVATSLFPSMSLSQMYQLYSVLNNVEQQTNNVVSTVQQQTSNLMAQVQQTLPQVLANVQQTGTQFMNTAQQIGTQFVNNAQQQLQAAQLQAQLAASATSGSAGTSTTAKTTTPLATAG